MPSVKIGAEEDVVQSWIDYWLKVWLDNAQTTERRCMAAKNLDELLRAPAWPST